MKKNFPSISLVKRIKKVISLRIIVCLLLFLVAVFSFSLYSVFNSFSTLKRNVDQQCMQLKTYIISQYLIGNELAITTKLEQINNKNSAAHIIWIKKDKGDIQDKINWDLLGNWHYSYPVTMFDHSTLGYLKVYGSFFGDKEILSQFLIQISLLLIFSLSVFFLLYPLAIKIPQLLFVNPINELLQLIKNKGERQDALKKRSEFFEIDEISNKIILLFHEIEEKTHAAALGKIATQVAHDIRSPLLVLTRILRDFSSLPEKKRIDARNAIQRVNDIANNLLTQYKQEKDTSKMKDALSSEPIVMMLGSIISEKRIQTADLGVDITLHVLPNAYDTFVEVDITNFKRVISNIINNAIEAVKNKKGNVNITVNKIDKKVIISIEDNGCGIPKNKLHTVFDEGVTFGKKEGLGLGLPYAASKITEWNGDYSLISEINVGTKFEMILSEAKPAEWFTNSIQIMEGGTIIALDDDDYIHQIWNERFSSAFLEKNHLALLHFNNSVDFIQFCDGKNFKHVTFLLDYEIGDDEKNGLSLAETFCLGKNATLITSQYEDLEVREKCKTLGMKIIPKFFAEHTRIDVLPKMTSASEIVFIDDYALLTEIWKESAENAGKSINVFTNPNDFIGNLNAYSKDTLIYIDSDLGDNLKGENVAKTLHEQNYRNIILTTGYPKENFKHVTWVKDVVEKNPPWG